MNTAAMMSLATGLTVVREMVAGAGDRPHVITRTIVGGTIATGVLLAVEAAAPNFGRGVAAIVLITAVLVHGVALADSARRIVSL